MKNGFIKVATASPSVRVADTAYNVRELIRLTLEAQEAGVQLLCFPELSVTSATAGDLYKHAPLVQGAAVALREYLKKTQKTSLLSVLGLPYLHMGRLYSCAAVCFGGKLLGLVPKSVLKCGIPSNELRVFSPADPTAPQEAKLDGDTVPFGTDLLFCADTHPALRVAIEIGSDITAPISPSVYASLAGATVICHPSASVRSVTSAKAYRDCLLAHSKRIRAAYLHAEVGTGESTTDYVWGGESLMAECGHLLAARDTKDASLLITEIDTERITLEQRQAPMNTSQHTYRTVSFSLPVSDTVLTRCVDPHPFMPQDPAECRARCERILSIQAEGLAQRTERAYAKTLVLGISGGLDSTLALLVAVRAMRLLGRSEKEIVALTMPCFGTTTRTKTNATVLCEALGVTLRTVDILNAVNVHFSDIGHDPVVHDATYENAQARERTQILMDVANQTGGMVVGTGDLSELALGWATYNGDHMSMYGVNASLPKTVIRHVVNYCADEARKEGRDTLAATLLDILDTPISPELLPASDRGEIAQKTEDLVGPYELHDFYLFYMLRYGFSPQKLYRLAKHAFGNAYDEETLKKWLKTFIRRFFSQQFKRSCLPDGPA
ncbi:MAG: NAD(+) synthase, partial [Ruminococcaceae bacterium]|nr:NAD(+) synthase [Oscillospiraceae bacterium]